MKRPIIMEQLTTDLDFMQLMAFLKVFDERKWDRPEVRIKKLKYRKTGSDTRIFYSIWVEKED